MEGEESFALDRLAMLEAETWVPQLIGAAAGTVQTALSAAGPAAAPAEVAWVVAQAAQGRGYASEAARSLVTVLRQAG